jgi:hypothetical protein
MGPLEAATGLSPSPAVACHRAPFRPCRCCLAPHGTAWSHVSSPCTEVTAGHVHSGQLAHRGLGNPPSLREQVSPLVWRCLLARLGGQKPRWPRGQRAHFGACGWLANRHYSSRSFGGLGGQYPPQGVDLVAATLLLRRVCCEVWRSKGQRILPRRTTPWGTRWGQLDGPWVQLASALAAPRAGFSLESPNLCNTPPPWGLPCVPSPVACPGFRIVTWLILPVVICLSQRLSHACLSISNYTVKLRMAH